ncbi:MAG TPA: (2Fe-2S)-binding protein [Actinocrinis sp.]|jgi:bacterioferritin-associated ferredoxin
MYACVCFCVTEEEVHEEIANGATSEEALGETCGAGTSCGTCVERLGCLISAALRDRSKAAALASCPVPCPMAQRVRGHHCISTRSAEVAA